LLVILSFSISHILTRISVCTTTGRVFT